MCINIYIYVSCVYINIYVYAEKTARDPSFHWEKIL